MVETRVLEEPGSMNGWPRGLISRWYRGGSIDGWKG